MTGPDSLYIVFGWDEPAEQLSQVAPTCRLAAFCPEIEGRAGEAVSLQGALEVIQCSSDFWIRAWFSGLFQVISYSG